ncbi:signal peptidase II [Actibacterium sp. XHP0104]|uniref:signal peptidase II n=1 Tax=Actibacterium sp. XHP0104 TaxID=2984335 RepID=UPI0021E7D380|nr:signal peptidase II [Actibacterium sp. XHP0104]MCV2881922.1 signal peptidase II [Actibacterium sp. XHP0104]
MRLLSLIAVVVFVVDQATKYAVVVGMDLQNRLAIDVWPPFLNFRMAWNRGVNFGLMANDADLMRWVLVGVAGAISLGVLIWLRRTPQPPLAMASAGVLVGGALGNMVDRIVWGAVADFLNMSCCGINNPFSFNVADIAIFAGALGLILFTPGNKTP